MGDCYKLSALQHWLNGMTGQNESEQIAEHIKSCIACQQRLADLTDDDSISPPADPSSLDGGSRFTSEPHFTSLKKRLSEQVKKMVREQKDDPFVDPENDELKNELATELQPVQDRDTVSAHDDPTVDTDADENPELDSMEPGFPDIEGFRIEKLIGKGGFAHVYQAWDSRLSRTVAVKVLDQHRIDARNRHRFSREAKTASSIDSPSVVKVLSSGETATGQPFIVMELVKGGSLADWIGRQQGQNQLDRNAVRQGVELVIQACQGAEAVHQAGMVHRDIKPGNIFVDQDISKLGDFGLARLLNGDTVTLTRAVETIGTPAYMSPEQTDYVADVDLRSDVYSLGATLYHVLTGQAPFRGSSLAILKQVTEVEPVKPGQLNESVSKELETICLKALSKLPEHRYASARELSDDLQRFIDGRPIVARPIPVWWRLIMWSNRNRALAGSLGLLFLTLVLGTATTTAMWFKSARNAAEARAYATDLEQNRARLRESVSRFQKRVFSQQAMHWQMPESFRAEMFADVVSYLDEFAELETSDEVVENTNVEQPDELTSDYLLVAQTALHVNRHNDAQIAADRALQRIRKISAGSNADTSDHLLHFRAALLGYMARTPTSKFFNLASPQQLSTLAERQQLALECLEAIGQIGEQTHDNPLWKSKELEARFLVIDSSADTNDKELEDATTLFDDFQKLLEHEADREVQLQVLESALRVGWFLSENLANEQAQEVLQQNIALVERMRESLRQLSQSLIESDWLKANNYARMAILKKANNDLEGAIESATEAQHAFRKAVLLRPQNKVWTNDMICLQLLLGDWLVEQGEFPVATETFNDAVMHNIRLAKVYPDDFVIQKRTVKMFVKMAEVCQKRKLHGQARRDYYIAARDCQLILLQDDHRDWAFRTRLWLVSSALEQLSLAPDEAILADLTRNELVAIKSWPEQFELDTSLMQDVLDRNHQPQRPKYLEFKQITEDILATDH